MEVERPTDFDDLPNEMLEEIFNRIPDANDFLAVLGTCRRWHDIMAYKKTERLFGKVFPILLQADPNTHPSRLLGTRGVCRKWKQEVDKQLDRQFTLRYFFRNAEQMTRFNTHSASLPRDSNPFLGNTRMVSTRGRGVYEPFLQTIQRHGHHLKNVGASIYNLDFLQNELVANLRHMPNLVTLEIGIMLENLDVGVAPPPLPHLKILVLRISSHLRNQALETRFQLVVSSFIAAYGIQLTSLTVPASLLRIEGIGNQLPNLTSLTIIHGGLTTEDLQVLAEAEWKLDALYFRVFNEHVAPTVILYTALNHFSATLTTLELPISIDESFDPRLLAHFSKLEVVSLWITTRLRSIPYELYSSFTHFATVAPNLVSLKLYLERGALPDVHLLSLGNPTKYFTKLTTFCYCRWRIF